MKKWSRRRTRWVVASVVLVAVLAGFAVLGRHYEEQDRRDRAAKATAAPSAPAPAPPTPVPTKAPTTPAPKVERPVQAPPSVPAPEVPAPPVEPGRPLQPSETTRWATMLRADDAKAPGRPQLADYELAFSTATRMCAQSPDEIVTLARRLAAKQTPLFGGGEGRAYSALGWMAAVEPRPQSDCSKAGAEMQ